MGALRPLRKGAGRRRVSNNPIRERVLAKRLRRRGFIYIVTLLLEGQKRHAERALGPKLYRQPVSLVSKKIQQCINGLDDWFSVVVVKTREVYADYCGGKVAQSSKFALVFNVAAHALP